MGTGHNSARVCEYVKRFAGDHLVVVDKNGKHGHWWWCDTVHEAVRQKKEAFKKWQRTRLEGDKRAYK